MKWRKLEEQAKVTIETNKEKKNIYIYKMEGRKWVGGLSIGLRQEYHIIAYIHTYGVYVCVCMHYRSNVSFLIY